MCNDEKDDENFGARAAVGLCVVGLGDGTLTVHLDNVDRYRKEGKGRAYYGYKVFIEDSLGVQTEGFYMVREE